MSVVFSYGGIMLEGSSNMRGAPVIDEVHELSLRIGETAIFWLKTRNKNNENLTTHQRILLDGNFSAKQKYFLHSWVRSWSAIDVTGNWTRVCKITSPWSYPRPTCPEKKREKKSGRLRENVFVCGRCNGLAYTCRIHSITYNVLSKMYMIYRWLIV